MDFRVEFRHIVILLFHNILLLFDHPFLSAYGIFSIFKLFCQYLDAGCSLFHQNTVISVGLYQTLHPARCVLQHCHQVQCSLFQLSIVIYDVHVVGLLPGQVHLDHLVLLLQTTIRLFELLSVCRELFYCLIEFFDFFIPLHKLFHCLIVFVDSYWFFPIFLIPHCRHVLGCDVCL